jgi:thiol-disulfide isomerase/thioredoxin
MKPIIFLITYFTLMSNSYAQNLYKITLKSQPSTKIFKSGIRPTYLDETVHAKKIPKGVNGDYLLKYAYFSYTKVGDEFQKKDKILNSERVYFLVGKNELGDIVIIPDLNYDFDFTNDDILTYPPLKTEVNINGLPFIKIPIKVENILSTYIIRPNPYPTQFRYNNSEEQDKYLMIESFQQQEGEFNIGKNTYKVFLHNKKPSPFFDDINAIEIAISVDDNIKIFQFNEVISLDGIKILAADVTLDGAELSFRQINLSESISGYSEGLNLPQINVFDIYSKEITFPLLDKFTLIDFWGTWCLPCLALTNDLKRINRAYLSKLSLVSVAYDSDINRVKNYISSNGMLWNHIFQLENSPNKGLIERFNIVEYPTFILTDKSGKIILRTSGADGLKQIESILKDN